MESHWLYNGKPLNEVPDKAFGFVYIITNLKTNKKYIGKKQFGSARRKPLTKKQKAAGRKKRTVIRKESDWKTYTGSNIQLNEDIEKIGKNSFKFEIIVVCSTKGQLSYLEETIQHKTNSLLSEKYYNDAIGSRKFATLKITEELKKSVDNLDF